MIFFILIWSLTTLAFFALASSIAKHQKQIFGHELLANQTRLATISGWLLLTISVIICMLNGQLSNMISYWIGTLSFSALFVGLCFSYFERKIRKIAIAIAVIFLISLILHLM